MITPPCIAPCLDLTENTELVDSIKRDDINQRLPNIHPGEILLEEFLLPLGISQNRLALDLSVLLSSTFTNFLPAGGKHGNNHPFIELLKDLKERYIADLEVMDEGAYWETNDRNLLEKNLANLRQHIDFFSEALQSEHCKGLRDLTPEELANEIGRMLGKK